jgi:hypothetical protein
MKLINALPKNNELRTFWMLSWVYDKRNQAVPINIARPRYMAILTPYARGSRYDFSS